MEIELLKKMAVFFALSLFELHHHQHGVVVLLQALGNGFQLTAQLARFEGFDEVKGFELQIGGICIAAIEG